MNARLRSAAIIGAVAVVDRVSKMYIQASISPFDTFPVIPRFFNIVHTENPGAAFGVFADSPGEWRGFFLVGISIVVMALIGAILWKPPSAGMHDSPMLRLGLALVFGGALGNLFDRLFRGTVTDFLQFFFGSYEFPSFNAADSAITIGAGFLLLDLWRNRRQRQT